MLAAGNGGDGEGKTPLSTYPAISAGVSFPPPCGEGCLSEAKTGWGRCEGCTPPLPLPTRGRGILFLLTTFLIESSHSSPCSVKEALSGYRFLSVEKGRCL